MSKQTQPDQNQNAGSNGDDSYPHSDDALSTTDATHQSSPAEPTPGQRQEEGHGPEHAAAIFDSEGAKPLEDHSVEELRSFARSLGIKGCVEMDKAELVEAVQYAQRSR